MFNKKRRPVLLVLDTQLNHVSRDAGAMEGETYTTGYPTVTDAYRMGLFEYAAYRIRQWYRGHNKATACGPIESHFGVLINRCAYRAVLANARNIVFDAGPTVALASVAADETVDMGEVRL